ncbi:hypothetical protein ACFLZZ_01780 [Nanoarchaeota archaeon]
MVWWLFSSKEEHNDLKTEVKQAFSAVKGDLKKASDWITHLNTRDKHHEHGVEEIHERLSSMEEEISEMKGFIAFFSTKMSKQLFKQRQTGVHKQTAVEGVQTPVQTAVQSSFLQNLSVMERAIVWTLLNTDLKLSCDDISSILNKERSTVRGQINSIKQKSEGLIDEVLEKSGKKRFFIPEEVRETVFSKMKADKGSRKKRKRESEY